MLKHYKNIFIAVILIKLLLAYFFPITSDEAYYLTWGLDVNYYDHPPMTGWIVFIFSLLGNHIFFVRLFPVVCSIIVAMGIYHIIHTIYEDQDRAELISMAFLVAPLNILFFPIATDTSLFLFVFLSGASFFIGINKNKDSFIFLAGVFLALASLSKWFAGLLFIAFLICLLFYGKRQVAKKVLILISGAIPFALLYLYWNYMDCWTNVMFNVFNRNQNVEADVKGFLTFLGFQIYLATPWVLYFLIRNFRKVKQGIHKDGNLFFWLFFIPIAILGIISFHDTGLHWFIAFYPFLFLILIYLKKEVLQKIVKYSAVLSLIHLVPVFVVLALPVEKFKNFDYYHDFILCKYGDELYDAIKETYGDQYILGTNGYYTSGALAYHSSEDVIVFHDDSKHGRYYDKITDFRDLDGKNILIMSTLEVTDDYSIYFDKLITETIRVRENDFHITLGQNFKFAIYHERFLKKILEDWYNIPDYLPIGDCYFFNIYFPE